MENQKQQCHYWWKQYSVDRQQINEAQSLLSPFLTGQQADGKLKWQQCKPYLQATDQQISSSRVRQVYDGGGSSWLTICSALHCHFTENLPVHKRGKGCVQYCACVSVQSALISRTETRNSSSSTTTTTTTIAISAILVINSVT